MLEGSNDGTTWSTVDRRTGESWAWASYTRSFSIASPKPYTQYRLVLTPAASADGVTLSEIELLGTLKGVEPGTHPSDQRVAATKPSPWLRLFAISSPIDCGRSNVTIASLRRCTEPGVRCVERNRAYRPLL